MLANIRLNEIRIFVLVLYLFCLDITHVRGKTNLIIGKAKNKNERINVGVDKRKLQNAKGILQPHNVFQNSFHTT